MKNSILKRYPELTQDDVILQDDGEGIYIKGWNSGKPTPSMAEVHIWVEEDAELPKPLSEVEELKKQQADLIFSLMMNGVM